MAGGERVRESSVNAAEAVHEPAAYRSFSRRWRIGAIPATLTGAGANPSITLPLGRRRAEPLQAEIMGQSDGNPDSADPTVGSTRNAVLANLQLPP